MLALDRAFPPDLTRCETLSPQLLDHTGIPLHVSTTTDGYWRLRTDPESVSPAYLDRLLAKEDRRFWWHPGVDPLALLRAMWQLATHGRVVSGGSTLAMQAARLLEPHPHDLAGKLRDMLRAVQLEAHYGRHGVLAMYLTLAPMGGNIEGVQAAARLYFQHDARALTPAEAALLVALPQHPARLRPDRHPAQVESGPVQRHPLPHLAWHLAMHLRRAGTVTTTIDANLQRALETMATAEQAWFGHDADLAVVILRNRDRAVLGYLGSADYFGPAGMVDAVKAIRSPGSTLKPFIYGMAIDDGLIQPATLIDDRLLRYGDYTPRNFDRLLHGAVTAAEALQQSYNLPAIALLARVGPSRFAATLRQAGITLRLPPGHDRATLPLALGGVGVSLEDLVALYAGLADRGRISRLRLRPEDPLTPGIPIMTNAAARSVTSMLLGTPPPNGIAAARPRAIAYKTGTSYGFRDARALGVSGDYTVGVWVGRAEGTPRPGAFGRDTAAPLMMRLFDLLPPEPVGPDAAPETARPVAPGLRHFATPGAAGPRITFPPANARIEFDRRTPLALEASGGTPPYRWMVNGWPLPPVPAGLTRAWQPDGAGFAQISVMDVAGRTNSETVRLVGR